MLSILIYFHKSSERQIRFTPSGKRSGSKVMGVGFPIYYAMITVKC